MPDTVLETHMCVLNIAIFRLPLALPNIRLPFIDKDAGHRQCEFRRNRRATEGYSARYRDKTGRTSTVCNVMRREEMYSVGVGSAYW